MAKKRKMTALRFWPLGLGILWLVPLTLWFGTSTFVSLSVDPVFLVSLCVIGLLASAMIAYEAHKAAFSLHLAHWLFVYIFFFAAPLVQYKVGVFPWRQLTSQDTTLLLTINLTILLWCVVWIATRWIHERGTIRLIAPCGPRVSAYGTLLTLLLASGATAYLVVTFGAEALLVRANYKETLNEAFTTSSATLVMDKLLRGLTVAGAAGSVWLMGRRTVPISSRLIVLVLGLTLLLIANFPLGASRYWFGAVYLGLALSVASKRIRSGWLFALLIVFGLLVVFPLVGNARNAETFSQAVSYTLGEASEEEPLAKGDFDAYAMIGYTHEYISEGSGITYGRQLLGPLLFYVPSEIWPNKPQGSGLTVANARNLSFDNVSSPPAAEALINFGMVGVPIFAAGFSLIFTALDDGYRYAASAAQDSLLYVIYPFLIGFTFLLLRGDLLSSTAFIAGFVASFLPLVAFFSGRTRRLHNRNQRPMKTRTVLRVWRP